MAELVTNMRDSIWCQSLWDSIRDGGVWAVPRSGLVFTKSEALRRFTVTERMPWNPGMPVDSEELREYQDEDFETIRKRFALIGIECSL